MSGNLVQQRAIAVVKTYLTHIHLNPTEQRTENNWEVVTFDCNKALWD